MAQQVVTLAKEETSQAILNILNNSEYGQEALEDILTNSTYGLNAIKGLVSDSKSLLQNSTYGLSALKTLIGGVGKTLKTERAIKIGSPWSNASLTFSGPGAVFIVVKKGISDYFYHTSIIIDGNSTGVGGVFDTNYTAPSGNYNSLAYFVITENVGGTSYVNDYYFIPIFFKESLVISGSSLGDSTAMTILYNRYQ